MYERRFPFVKLDVFTATPLEGNQLAVFTDARGLSDADMQALAREMNLSETTFVFPRDFATERERGIRTRIFTVAEELPFAGHPTLGTAFALHGPDRRFGGGSGKLRVYGHENRLELDLNVGKIPVEFSFKDGRLFGEMTQPDPAFGNVLKPEDVAPVAGLEISDLERGLPIQTVSTGMPFAIVPLKSLEALGRIRLDWKRAEEYLSRTDAKFLYFITPGGIAADDALGGKAVPPGGKATPPGDKATPPGGEATPKMRARMIFYNGEDPATGSAAGCCAAWMVRHGVAQPDQPVLIEQGVEMKRRSLIHVRASKSDVGSTPGKSTEGYSVVNVRVGGNVVEVMQGEVFL
ncbi:MAG: PhzF family phenazine biosynthesis protein [Acidobacteriota bacterium]|nr:PhzF family phenazine biosynthesis protein [Acidobacteriota bacterium]